MGHESLDTHRGHDSKKRQNAQKIPTSSWMAWNTWSWNVRLQFSAAGIICSCTWKGNLYNLIHCESGFTRKSLIFAYVCEVAVWRIYEVSKIFILTFYVLKNSYLRIQELVHMLHRVSFATFCRHKHYPIYNTL